MGCLPAHVGDGAVGYELTSLAPEANLALRRLADRFPRFLGHWRALIAATI